MDGAPRARRRLDRVGTRARHAAAVADDGLRHVRRGGGRRERGLGRETGHPGAGWLVSLQLWSPPLSLVLIPLPPVMLAAHRRWELAVPAVMALAAAGVDAGVLGPHLHLIGFATYFLVWGSMHQWGFAWRDGTLTHPRWRPYALAAGGAAVLAGLLAWSPFPVDMIGFGGVVGNTTPP